MEQIPMSSDEVVLELWNFPEKKLGKLKRVKSALSGICGGREVSFLHKPIARECDFIIAKAHGLPSENDERILLHFIGAEISEHIYRLEVCGIPLATVKKKKKNK